MIIYTYQPQSLIDNIYANDFAFVIYEETNLFKQSNGKVNQYQNAYMWMARKLGEKTGIWMKDLYGNNINLPKDADGDYVDEEGQKLPVLPFWGWYLTDGKNQKPDPEMYCFDSRVISSIPQWSKSDSRTMLLTLDVPEKQVLLSDANAWYCILEGRPCYDYEPDVEAKNAAFKRRMDEFKLMPEKSEKERAAKTEEAQALWQETVSSWDNILRLEGRQLREFMGMKECYDIQAVFPAIMKDWIVAVEDVL